MGQHDAGDDFGLILNPKPIPKVRVFADPKYGKKLQKGPTKYSEWLSNRSNLLMLLANLLVAYLMFDYVGIATSFLELVL